MGWLERLFLGDDFGNDGGADVQARASIDDQIQAALSARQAAFGVDQARKLIPVRRALDLLTSVGASFAPQVRETPGGAVASSPPRLVERPDPYMTRREWMAQSIECLAEGGNLYWLLGPSLDGIRPTFARVLDPDEVLVHWDARQMLPVYQWRGRSLARDVEIKHVAIRRRPGELKGTGPLTDSLEYLATVDAQEQYAALQFGSGGVPSTVLITQANLTAQQATELQDQYATSRAAAQGTGKPAIASGGVSLEFPGANPESMQLNASRVESVNQVARLFGIPGSLLLASITGSLTYTNASQQITHLARQTVVPMYLDPIESALSDLAGVTVEHSLGELLRASVAERVELVDRLMGMDLSTREQAADYLGIPRSELPALPAQDGPGAAETGAGVLPAAFANATVDADPGGSTDD